MQICLEWCESYVREIALNKITMKRQKKSHGLIVFKYLFHWTNMEVREGGVRFIFGGAFTLGKS